MNTKFDVVALGELLIDFTAYGTSEQGNGLFEACPGGAPCNVLAMLRKLGKSCAFVGKVGNDMFRNLLRQVIQDAGINADNLKLDDEIPTTLSFVKTLPGGDRDFTFYRKPGADMMLTEDEGVVAVQQFNLEIADKEFIVLVGPSGCGKSTVLRMIAGLEEISGGELYIGGKLVNDVPPKDRDIAMVFQNYAPYPHMTVYDNMAFSMKLRKVPKDEIDRKVREAAAILDITQYLDRKPKALSGGQRQRVAIGRAIVREPKVLLMDEPLSNLDAKLRNQMRTEIIKLRKRINTTFIYVTHDQTEAMTLGDRIVIMKDGFIQQIGTPQEVFNHPANTFVAGFIGVPQMNFFNDAKLTLKNGRYAVEILGHSFGLEEKQQQALKAANRRPGAVIAGVRPVHVQLGHGGIPAKLEVSEMMGSEKYLHTTVGGTEIVAVVPTLDAGDDTDTVELDFLPGCIHLFDPDDQSNLL